MLAVQLLTIDLGQGPELDQRCLSSKATSRWLLRWGAATKWSRAAKLHRPDVSLLEVEMPGMDRIAATEALRAAPPDVRVMIVTTFGRPGYICGGHSWPARQGSSSRTPRHTTR